MNNLTLYNNAVMYHLETPNNQLVMGMIKYSQIKDIEFKIENI